RRICIRLVGTVLGVPQLDSVDLPCGWHGAVSPSGPARRSVPQGTLRRGICGVFQARRKVSLSTSWAAMTKRRRSCQRVQAEAAITVARTAILKAALDRRLAGRVVGPTRLRECGRQRKE